MTVYRLSEQLAFPSPSEAEADGLLAVGGDLDPERLLLAYASGIFPWFSEDLPILWYSPDPRAVLRPTHLHVGRSLRKTLRRRLFEVRLDTAFDRVIRACAWASRPGQDGTWITAEMIEAYSRLHRLGYAHSAEAWDGERLVGGVYGVSLGAGFFGESMFALAPDASKVAFVYLVRQLQTWGIELIDCQMENEHLERFGVERRSRERFLEDLAAATRRPTRRGAWRFDEGFLPAEALSPTAPPRGSCR